MRPDEFKIMLSAIRLDCTSEISRWAHDFETTADTEKAVPLVAVQEQMRESRLDGPKKGKRLGR